MYDVPDTSNLESSDWVDDQFETFYRSIQRKKSLLRSIDND